MPRARISLFLSAVLLYCVIALVAMRGEHGASPDVDSYMAIAKGHMHDAYGPFSSRPLHPMLVFLLSRLTGAEAESVFAGLDLVVLAVFIALAVFLISRYSREDWLLFTPIPLLLAPWLTGLARVYYHPDFFMQCLAALFFIVFASRPRLTLPILYVLFLVRESTALLAISLICVALMRREVRFAMETIAVSIAAFVTSMYIAGFGQPNVHQLGAVFYLVAKVLHQIPYNCLGLLLSIDKHHSYQYFTPKYVIDLPNWSILGGASKLAYLGWNPLAPLGLAAGYLTTFGLIPLLLVMNFRWIWRRARTAEPIIAVALLYSALCLITAPALGNAVLRYLSYAWPAALIAAPFLLARLTPAQGSVRYVLTLLHMALCWLPVACSFFWPLESVVPALGMLAAAAALNFAALRIFRRVSATSSEPVECRELAVERG